MIPALAGAVVFAVLFLKSDSREPEDSAPKKEAPDNTPAPAPSASSFDKSWNTDPLFSDKLPPRNNPDDLVGPEVDEPGPPMDPIKAIQDLAETICKQILACPKISPRMTQYGCVQGLLEYEGLSSSFGISQNLTLQRVLKDNGMGYSADSKALNKCLEGIKKFSCGDFEEENSVEDIPTFADEDGGKPAEKNPLGGIEDHFGSSKTPGCGKIFKPKPISCDPGSSSTKINSNAVQDLAGTICSEAATCNPGMACEACFGGVLSSMKFADKLGLNRLSLQAIDYGLSLGLYSVNEEALGKCLAELKSRGCSKAGGIWDSESPNSFSGLVSIIPRGESSCSKVFEQPKASCETGATDPITSFAEDLCGQVVTCRPEVPCDHCVSEVSNDSRIPYQLGYRQKNNDGLARRKAVEKWTLNGIRNQIQQGKLFLDASALDQCASDIQEQTCLKIQLGMSDYSPGRDLVGGIMGLFSGGSGSCKLVLNTPSTTR